MIKDLVEVIKNYKGKPITLMEVCGTHTMSIARIGLKDVLPSNIRIVSGPGCPVCVTHQDYIEKALILSKNSKHAKNSNYAKHEMSTKICTFGDLMRVPGESGSLAEMGDVQIVYSPLECILIAQENPDMEIVFLSIGFETTTPSVALAVLKASELGITNLSFLTANKTMPNVLETLLADEDLGIDGLIYPGHVATIEGTSFFKTISKKHKIPGVIAGFEPIQVLTSVCELIRMIEAKEYSAQNLYKSVVREEGNPNAREIVEKVFEPVNAVWRGFGMIEGSGLGLRKEYAQYDAEIKFSELLKGMKSYGEPAGCRCGEVLKGKISPNQCKLFGTVCSPESPIGACMVSSEGSCAAEFRYGGVR